MVYKDTVFARQYNRKIFEETTLAVTPSTMLPLGTKAPDFKLPDTISGQIMALDELKSDTATVIMFTCNHCPFVKLIREKVVETARTYQDKGVSFIAICANDANAYPEDSPLKMKQQALDFHFTFPYLHDETQQVAKAYHAACTPDFYIFDKDLKCVYRGRFDNATPGNGQPVTGEDLIAALDDMLVGKQVSAEQFPSYGCNIKWRK
jgi:peroxiredoxin